MLDDDPLCLFLVIDGSRGQRMLFRYPFQENVTCDGERTPPQKPKVNEDIVHNPYRLKKPSEVSETSNFNSNKRLFQSGLLYGFDDDELASLLACKTNLCNTKFELDIDLVKLIGFPVLVVPSDECQG